MPATAGNSMVNYHVQSKAVNEAATRRKQRSLVTWFSIIGVVFALVAIASITRSHFATPDTSSSSIADINIRRLLQVPSGTMPGGAIPIGGTSSGGEMPGGEMPGGKMPGGEMPGGKMPGGKPILNCEGTCARCKENPCKKLDCTNNQEICNGCKMRWSMDCTFCKDKKNKCSKSTKG